MLSVALLSITTTLLTTAPRLDEPAPKPVPDQVQATRKAERPKPPPTRVLLLGDSFIVSAFGSTLERLLEGDGTIDVLRRGKSSTGLSRPDFFDWWKESKKLIAQHDPTLVVILMGGNDGQDLRSVGSRARTHWGKPQWDEAYAERVKSLLTSMEKPGRTLLWLELPPMMDAPRFEAKVEHIRGVQRGVVDAFPSAHWIETDGLFRDDKGRLLRTVPSTDKPVRDDDGIHFTVEGGNFFAEQVAPLILQHLEPRVAQTVSP